MSLKDLEPTLWTIGYFNLDLLLHYLLPNLNEAHNLEILNFFRLIDFLYEICLYIIFQKREQYKIVKTSKRQRVTDLDKLLPL